MATIRKRRTVKKQKCNKVNRSQKGGWGRAASRLFRRSGSKRKITKTNISAPTISMSEGYYLNKALKNIMHSIHNAHAANRVIKGQGWRERYDIWNRSQQKLADRIITDIERQKALKLSEESKKQIYNVARNPNIRHDIMLTTLQNIVKTNRQQQQQNKKSGYIEVKPYNN